VGEMWMGAGNKTKAGKLWKGSRNSLKEVFSNFFLQLSHVRIILKMQIKNYRFFSVGAGLSLRVCISN
jgi:hypothetical protein